MTDPLSFRVQNSTVPSDSRLGRLVDTALPKYRSMIATAEQAQKLRADLAQQGESHTTEWPTEATEVTAEWVDTEVRRRVGSRDLTVRLEVLSELENNARTEAHYLVLNSSNDLLALVAKDLDAWLNKVSAAVESLGPDVHSASDAIASDKVDAWKVISASVTKYREIREVQKEVYSKLSWPFDAVAVGGGNPDTADRHSAVSDPEARLYFHRRLNEIAPGWRNLDAVLPWPSDPVERIIWCIRNDSGIWCPTPKQVKTALASPGGEVPPPRGRGNSGPSVRRKYDSEGHSKPRDQSAHGFRAPAPADTAAESTPLLASGAPDLWNTPR